MFIRLKNCPTIEGMVIGVKYYKEVIPILIIDDKGSCEEIIWDKEYIHSEVEKTIEKPEDLLHKDVKIVNGNLKDIEDA